MTVIVPIEFVCCECGRHIVIVIGELPEPRLCGACIFLPGWPDMPEVARLIDPEHHRTVGGAS